MAVHFSLRENETPNRRLADWWIWAFPVAQILHGIEERFEGYGFHIWLRSIAQAPFSARQTELMHAGFTVAMIVACIVAMLVRSARWIAVSLSVLVLLNALSHVVGAFLSSSATSGIISSVVVWLPLGVYGLVRGWRELSRPAYSLGVLIGAVIQLPLTWLAVVVGLT